MIDRRESLEKDRFLPLACELIVDAGAVFALWGKPSLEDMDRVASALRQAVEKAGRPVTYIARVPADAPAPDANVRRHLDTLMPEIVDRCSTYHVVLEGDGFLVAMKRAVLLGLFQLRWRRGVFFVHSSVSELLHQIPQADLAAASHIVELARTAGLLQADRGRKAQDTAVRSRHV